jgi:hypothetical protein
MMLLFTYSQKKIRRHWIDLVIRFSDSPQQMGRVDLGKSFPYRMGHCNMLSYGLVDFSFLPQIKNISHD